MFAYYLVRMIPPLQSLVKYDSPVLVSTNKDKKGAKGKGKLPPVETKPNLTPTEDILNSILPPREWTEDSRTHNLQVVRPVWPRSPYRIVVDNRSAKPHTRPVVPGAATSVDPPQRRQVNNGTD